MAAFMKSTLSHETVADTCDDQLEVLAFKINGPREIQLDIIVVYRPPSQSFNLDGILKERLQEFSRASATILVGDFNDFDMTTSSHESSFDARLLSFCLDNFLVHHSILATRSVSGQRENCLDLVFTKLSEDIYLVIAITYRYTLIMYVSLAQIQVETGNETYGRSILKA